LWRVERSLPSLHVVLVASCCPRADLTRGRQWSAQFDFGTSVDNLVHTVDRLLRGATVHEAPSWARPDHTGPRELEFLTPREREILQLLGTGASVTNIAAQLEIADNTVRTHIANIRSKLGVHSRLDAVRLVYGQAHPTAPLWAR
jgi:DNA-binding NarL/FixJ family response regulator